ncbi:MAG TPA: CSLREA domain-containing protein [Thermoanaerobaculia bacterium]|nr:CSLREA domain-containing protein [Thermoanaerobaculia bacterium]
MVRSSLKIPALALVAALSAAIPAAAKVFIPTTTNDTPDGSCELDCSLRDAITEANQSPGFDAIVLAPGTYQLGSFGPADDLNATGDLDVRDDLAIIGASAERTIIEGSTERVFDIQAGTTVEITGVTIRNGRTQVVGNGGGIRNAGVLTLSRVLVTGNNAGAGAGGGIYSSGGGSSLTVAQSAVTGNSAATLGGGIALDGALTLTDSTISGNLAGTIGGGIYAFNNSDAEITNVTITANQAVFQAGGLFAESVPFQTTDRPVLRNTILAGNTAPTDRDCGGAPASAGHNILGVGGTCIDFTAGKSDLVGTAATPRDPKLGPLANNGGTTPTHALLAGSPALGAAASCTPTDQRGVDRTAGTCDIGAFELSAACLTGGPTLCLNGDRFKVTVTFRTSGGQPSSAQAVQLTTDTGYFWFFNQDNVEVTIKVLNGCGVNQHYWAFLSGMTNVEVTMQVTDTATGQTKTYTNPLNRVFRTVLDTGAFSCN